VTMTAEGVRKLPALSAGLSMTSVRFKPAFSLYCDSAPPWQISPETKPAFAGMFVPLD
jgi:hypothetical protein